MDSKTIAERQLREKQQATDKLTTQRHAESLAKIDALAQSNLDIMRSFVAYLNKRTSKTEITNQLRSIATPDALKLIPIIQALDKTVKDKKVDLTPVTDALKPIFDELSKLPKEHPKAGKQFEFDYTKIEALGKVFKTAISQIKLTVEAPIINVPKADAPIINTEKVDLTPFVNEVLQVLTDFRIWTQDQEFPEAIDLTNVEKLLTDSKGLLTKIEKKNFGGGGGGGGGGYVFKESALFGRGSPLLAPELTFSGQLPVSTAMSLPVHDYIAVSQTATVDTYVYKTGGAGGTTVATLTLTYTDGTKTALVSVART